MSDPSDSKHEEVENNELPEEFEDAPEELGKKILKLAELMHKSKCTIFFTGLQQSTLDSVCRPTNRFFKYCLGLGEKRAGISTNTQRLPDFRGTNGLVRTGNRPPMTVMGKAESKMDSIMPTYTHCALKLLVDKGYVKGIVTSNHDGLQNKCGVASENCVDLFGNVYVERCTNKKCKQYFLRHTIVPHLRRTCETCGKKLVKKKK
ncbi:chromatin regulatory protein sir2 [Reticulomyxa filosa]|uniref:Regulatory protein SIR2 homolog 7 n=1 Tax=Reticulomyxa filosa TaxID=46433 RepID=X6MGK9_RETFI|nr:chromatin regulatory protein sir2 [Reticulomyxa filosa]|eukprot:ETO13019.1 chromatin regulatory protein sir2 [Reticulomyxa filosa]